MAGVAFGVEDRPARHGYRVASECSPEVLDLESSAGQAGTAGDISGDSRTHPPHEQRKS